MSTRPLLGSSTQLYEILRADLLRFETEEKLQKQSTLRSWKPSPPTRKQRHVPRIPSRHLEQSAQAHLWNTKLACYHSQARASRCFLDTNLGPDQEKEAQHEPRQEESRLYLTQATSRAQGVRFWSFGCRWWKPLVQNVPWSSSSMPGRANYSVDQTPSCCEKVQLHRHTALATDCTEHRTERARASLIH